MNKELMRRVGFAELVDRVEGGLCPLCNKPIDATTFRDELSLKEFKISGTCQKCQDGIFGK